MPGRVHRLDHLLELLHLAAGLTGGAVAVVGREEADRVVAPVVAQPALDEVGVLDELVHRQQLDRRDAERRQVLERGRVREPGVGAAQLLGDAGMALREALDVHLVDDGLVPGRARRPVVRPVEERARHDALGHVRARVEVVDGTVRVLEAVAEQGLVPVDLALDGGGVGIQQQLGGVAAKPGGGLERAVDPEPVALPRAQLRRVAVPDHRRALGQGDPRLGAVGLEQAELDRVGDLGEHGEVRPRAVVGRAEREGGSGPQAHEERTLPAIGRANRLPCGRVSDTGR